MPIQAFLDSTSITGACQPPDGIGIQNLLGRRENSLDFADMYNTITQVIRKCPDGVLSEVGQVIQQDENDKCYIDIEYSEGCQRLIFQTC